MWRGTSYSTLLHGTVILLLLFGLPSLPLIFKRTAEEPTSLSQFAPGQTPDQERRGAAVVPPDRPRHPQDRPAGTTGTEPSAIAVVLVPAGELAPKITTQRQTETGSGNAAAAAEEPPPQDRRAPGREADAPPPDTTSTATPQPRDKAARAPTPVAPPTAAPAVQPPAAARPDAPLAAVLDRLARRDARLDRALRRPDRTALTPAQAAQRQRNFERISNAASKGYANAQFNLAVLIQQGAVTPPDPAAATKLLERAAERGNLRAQILLAYNAAAAPSAKRDLARADFWLSVAAERNSKAAKEARALLKPLLSLDDEMRARQMRAEWQRMMALIPPAITNESDQNKVDEELREAAEKGDIDGVLDALLRGADAASRDRFGRNAIINAAWRGRENVVRLMLERGTDLEAADNRGRTPVNWAAINGHRSVVEMLLDGGADPDRVDAEGTTALIRAAWNGYDAVVRRLIAAGARLDTRDRQGMTALDRARSAGQTDVVRLLQAATAAQGGRAPASPAP